jgi:hypothetical protein
MFRHLVRHIVKTGEFEQFREAFKAFNAGATGAGLPSYRLWRTLFGDINEVWSEAQYDSLDGHVQALEEARADAEFMRAFRAMLAHTVPATLHDYPLEPIELGE